MKLLSQRQYAALRGVSHTAVQKAIKLGRIELVENGKIDADDADRRWAENTEGATPVEAKAGAARFPTYNEARTARAAYEAQLAGLELAEKRRDLLRASEVSTAIHDLIATSKSKLLLIGDELGDRISAESDPIKCREMIAAEIRAALQELSKYQVA